MGHRWKTLALAIVMALATPRNARAECPGDPSDCPAYSDPTWLAIGLSSAAIGYLLPMWGSRSNMRKTSAAIHIAAAVAGAMLLAAGTHVLANPADPGQQQRRLGPEEGTFMASTGALAVITGIYAAAIRIRF